MTTPYMSEKSPDAEKGCRHAGPAVSLIFVSIAPERDFRVLARPKTALQLLEALGYEEETALVVRDGSLLTPDRRVWPGDHIRILPAGSRG